MAARTEQLGYESLWVPEHYFSCDFPSLVGAAAYCTTKIQLGVAATNPHTRSIPLLAMTVATLDRLSRGRLILGLGSGDAESMRKMSIVGSLKTLERSVSYLRSLLSDEADGIGLAIKPPRKSVPIYLAVNGAKGLALAAKIAEGVLINFLTPVEYVGRVVSELHAARQGRQIELCGLLMVSLDLGKESYSFLKRTVVNFLHRCKLGERLNEAEGHDPALLRQITELAADGRGDLAASMLPRALIESLCIFGDAQMCRERVKEYQEAGLDLPILVPPAYQFEKIVELLSPR